MPLDAYLHEEKDLKSLLEAHGQQAMELLKRWSACVSEFVRVFPKDFKAAVQASQDRGEHNPIGSMRKYLSSQEALLDHSGKRIRLWNFSMSPG